MDNKYEQLLDKYITLLVDVNIFIDQLEGHLEEPDKDTLTNIQELVEGNRKLFNSEYYVGKSN